jgi:hypothetical protein
MQVRDIARVGVVSEATVRSQVKMILAKLDLTSQLAAVGAAHMVGWRSPGAESATTNRRQRHLIRRSAARRGPSAHIECHVGMREHPAR